MAEDIVGGLFGINPAMYQQQQQKQVFDRAVAMQNLDPFQQAAVGYQQAGYNLAGALGGAMGGVDPQLQRISTLNAISKQIDQSNPESMMSGAKMLADAGFMQEALGLAQYARKANSEIALAQQRMKEGRVAAGTDAVFAKINPSDYTPESVKAFIASSNYGDLVPKTGKADKLVGPVNPSDYTPASIAAFNISGNYADLVLKPSKADKPEKLIGNVNPSDYTSESIAAFSLSNNYSDLVLKPSKAEKPDKLIGNVNPESYTPASVAAFSLSNNYNDLVLKPEKAAADRAPPSVGGEAERISQTRYGKRFSELSQAEAAIVDAEVERRDLAAKKAAAASVKVDVSSAQKQEGAFSTETGKLDAQVLADTRTSAISAAQALTTIASMKQLDKTGQLVTGPLANSYVGASNLLASIGLLSKNQVSILTSSQVYDKSAKDLVMQDLGGKLGAQISDADRKFVEDRIPQLTTSAKARTELLDKIEQIQKGKVEYFRKMKAHANKYRNLDEFDFSEVYTVIPAAGSSAATATKAKADAIIKGEK